MSQYQIRKNSDLEGGYRIYKIDPEFFVCVCDRLEVAEETVKIFNEHSDLVADNAKKDEVIRELTEGITSLNNFNLIVHREQCLYLMKDSGKCSCKLTEFMGRINKALALAKESQDV